MVIVIARFRPKPERLDEFLELLSEVQAASRADAGCLGYGYYREIDDDMAFVAVEEWEEEAALAAHLRTPHVARLIAALPEHAAAPVDIAAHTVEHSGRLPLPRDD
jgi:quinol monooxygenase YgiN